MDAKPKIKLLETKSDKSIHSEQKVKPSVELSPVVVQKLKKAINKKNSKASILERGTFAKKSKVRKIEETSCPQPPPVVEHHDSGPMYYVHKVAGTHSEKKAVEFDAQSEHFESDVHIHGTHSWEPHETDNSFIPTHTLYDCLFVLILAVILGVPFFMFCIYIALGA